MPLWFMISMTRSTRHQDLRTPVAARQRQKYVGTPAAASAASGHALTRLRAEYEAAFFRREQQRRTFEPHTSPGMPLSRAAMI